MTIQANHWERRARIEMAKRDPIRRWRFVKVRNRMTGKTTGRMPTMYQVRRTP